MIEKRNRGSEELHKLTRKRTGSWFINEAPEDNLLGGHGVYDNCYLPSHTSSD